MEQPLSIRSFLLVLALSAVLGVRPSVADEAEAWATLRAELDSALKPLPVGRMFGDLAKELKISRRAPYTGSQREKIDKRRTEERLARERIRAERKKREQLVTRVGAQGDAKADKALMKAFESQLSNVDLARRNLDRHDEALRIDIDPGRDPGGVYWERWVRDHERPAARGVLAEEQKVAELALRALAARMTPEVKGWLGRHASSHSDPDVREQMVRALAGRADADNAAALLRIFLAEREVWARVMILDAVSRAKMTVAAQVVHRGLADAAWPVRSAAVASLRTMGLRDADSIDALVTSLASADGRLRLDLRHALAEATGQSFGIESQPWKLWWGKHRAGWTPPAAAARVEELTLDLPHFCGHHTASKRIVFLVSRGKAMAEPTKRRPTANDGNPSPEPAVDTTQRIAAWELAETLAGLPEDALFTVITFGAEPSVWAKKPKAPSSAARRSAVKFVRKCPPEGPASIGGALAAALRIGVPKNASDLALAGEGPIDTIFVVGGDPKYAGSLGGRLTGQAAVNRVKRLRQVRIRTVRVGHK